MDDIKFRTFDANKPVRRPKPTASTSMNKQPAVTPKSANSFPPKAVPANEPLIPLDRLKNEKAPKSRRKDRQQRKKRSLGKPLLITVSILALLGAGGFAGYNYLKNQNSELAKASDFSNNSEELALAIKEEVSKHLEDVPSETPKLETIDDPSSAGNGAGFNDTEKGDKVLYFNSAGKAIIYRPSTGKVLVYTYFTDSAASQEQKSDTTESESSADTLGESTGSGSSPLLP